MRNIKKTTGRKTLVRSDLPNKKLSIETRVTALEKRIEHLSILLAANAGMTIIQGLKLGQEYKANPLSEITDQKKCTCGLAERRRLVVAEYHGFNCPAGKV